MIEMNPSYLAFLEGLNEIDKAQLLHGNWDATPKGANYWLREWLIPITLKDLPRDTVACRSYDLAATERSQANKFPDPTAGIRMEKDKHNRVYVRGSYHEDFYDDHYEIYGQFCKRSGDRDNHIIKQAYHDGDHVTIVLPLDPAAAGKTAYESMALKFMGEGFKVKPDPVPNNKSKLVKFQPFASACENKLVYIVEDTFDKKTLEFIYKQLESFDGERSSNNKKDEFADILAQGFNFLMKARVHKPFTLPSVSAPTLLANHRRHM